MCEKNFISKNTCDFVAHLCPLATSKTQESVVEGEEKEKNSSEEITATKPLTKEEEMSDLKVETPELKVNPSASHHMLHTLQTPLIHVFNDENL